MAVSGNIAFAGAYGEAVRIINVTTKTNISEVGNTPVIDVVSLEQKGDVIYAGDYFGIVVVDVSDRSRPLIKKRLPRGLTNSMREKNGLLYAASKTDGLTIYDLTDPLNPAARGSYPFTDASDVELGNNVAYVAERAQGFRIINTTDPDNLTLVGSYLPGGFSVRGIGALGNHVYLATNTGMRVIDISTPATPAFSNNFNHDVGTNYYSKVETDGTRIYLTEDSGSWDELIVVNVSTPSAPVAEKLLAPAGHGYDVRLRGTRMYLALDFEGVHEYDIQDPANPKLLALGEDGTFRFEAVIADGNYIYVALDQSGGAAILDARE
jgi:hypothetical protein